MNYIVITIDALSKWYIDAVKTNGDFWSQLERECISFENMFSVGPFTEAAVRGMWAGEKPLEDDSYFFESSFANGTIFDYFDKKGSFIYIGQLIPFFNYKTKNDNKLDRERCEFRAFEHIWNGRLLDYVDRYKNEGINASDLWKLEYLLEEFFDKYGKSDRVKLQSDLYYINKNAYIIDVLDRGEKSNLFKAMKSELFFSCKYNDFYNLQKQSMHLLTNEEAILIKTIKNLNVQRYFEINNSVPDTNRAMSDGMNRCIKSNNDVLFHMRDEAEVLPKLKEELDQFIQWYDAEGVKLQQPFFAYIHNYDFHYPENFMNNRCDNKTQYDEEVKILCNKVQNLPFVPMSISKQLSLDSIENNLKYFYSELDKRRIFDKTRVILTADHGISNYMFKNNIGGRRWNYTRINFQVPFYMKGCGIIPNSINGMIDNTVVPKLLSIEDISSNFIDLISERNDMLCTSWVNGVPDYDRCDIKFGVRNNNISITFQGMFTQLFQSLDILGIYNLNNDPNETTPLPSDFARKLNMELLEYAKEQWIKLVIGIISNSNSNYGYLIKYSYILEKQDEYSKMNKCLKMSKSEFKDMITGKDVIIFGRGVRAKRFLDNYASLCKVKEVWDNNANDVFYYGHKLRKPHKTKKQYQVVICSRYEIEIIYQLKSLGINTFVSVDAVQNEDYVVV